MVKSFGCWLAVVYLMSKNPDLALNSLLSKTGLSVHKIIFASFCLYAVVFYCGDLIQFGETKMEAILQLCLTITVGVSSYFLVLIFTKFPMIEGKPLLFKLNQK